MSYRPVSGESPGRAGHAAIQPDAFLDGRGRVWYAQFEDRLPADPEKYEKIPEEYWHPDSRRHMNAERRRQAESRNDEKRAEERRTTQLSVMP